MARFYGVVKGRAKSHATRCGSASGLTTWAASWKGAIEVELYVNGAGRDCFRVSLIPWQGVGKPRRLAYGEFGKNPTVVIKP